MYKVQPFSTSIYVEKFFHVVGTVTRFTADLLRRCQSLVFDFDKFRVFCAKYKKVSLIAVV